MDIRYSANPAEAKKYDTAQLRKEFLIEKVFTPDEIHMTYSHVDRVIVIGAMPVSKKLNLEENVDCHKILGVEHFLDRREIGIINVGGTGKVYADGQAYELERLSALYIGKESMNIEFESCDSKNPAKFYMCSCPAHTKYPTTLIPFATACKRPCGAQETANKRIINQLIHPDVLKTCQLSMGCTQLEVGSVWNTLPSHTHERRMEVYFYFDLDENNAVMHYMGQPQETRHIVMTNEQAVISPSWSIHSGCGTSNYSFIWAMAGENMEFDDMDHIRNQDLR